MSKSEGYLKKQRLLELLNYQRWRSDPTLWAEQRLGLDRKKLVWSLNKGYEDHKWDGDVDPIHLIGTLLTKEHARVGVESGVGTGKTFAAALLLLWFLDSYPDQYNEEGELVEKGARVISVAPKSEQLRLNLWKEVGRLWPKFRKLHPQAQLMSLRIRMNPDPEAKDAWGAVGYPVGVGVGELSATKLQGFHDPHMFFIVEETPGVPKPVLEAINQTSRAPHNIILCLGNPDHEHDTLHQWCMRPAVDAVRISAYDHPNVVLKNPRYITGATTQKSIDDSLEERKDASDPLFESRVRGICPRISQDALFRTEVIAAVSEAVGHPLRIQIHEGVANGKTKVFKEVEHTHVGRYVIFADVGGDGYTGSWHAAVVLDRLDASIAATIHMEGPRDDYAKEIIRLANEYIVTYVKSGEPKTYYPLIAWETNGVGALHLVPIFAAWPNKYHRRSLERDRAAPRKTLGWATTTDSRETMIQELQMWSLDLIAEPWKLRDEEILKEAKTFVFVPSTRGTGGKYKARSGHRDDLIMATAGALTVSALTPKPIKVFQTEREIRIKHYLERKRQRSGQTGVNYMGSTKAPFDSLPTVP